MHRLTLNAMNRQVWTVALILLGGALGIACGVFTVRTYNAYGVGVFVGFTILGLVLGALLANRLLYR